MSGKDVVLVCCAHNDDQILGVGGTIAKYAKSGKSVITVIFSYGEGSHPWLKQKVTRDFRVDEAKRAEKLIGEERTFYLGVREGHFEEDLNSKGIKERLRRIISVIRPNKIFTHSSHDPHPDHKAVYSVTAELADALQHKCDIYSFNIWNLVNFRKPVPMLVEDITETFDKKVKAFKMHRSQKMAMLTMMPAMYVRAMLGGIKYGYRYAEVFEKIR
jgi:N-acetylglucosamine malate deacetylase 1